MKKHFRILFFVLVYCFPKVIYAEESDSSKHSLPVKLGVALNLSTVGIGLSLKGVLPKKSKWGFEIGYHYFRFVKPQTYEVDVNSDVFILPNLRHNMVSGFVNWRPFKKRAFFIKSGLAYDFGQRYSCNITSPTGLKLDGLEIAKDDFGIIDVSITWNKLMPYLGVGFGRTIPRKRYGVSVDVGTFYMGSPKINSHFEGFLETTNLDTEMVKIQNNIKNYSYYPFIAVNFTYKLTKN